MTKTPDLSLVLACYNEKPIFAESVSRILSTLARTRYTWEIIFVDDHSRDRTPELISQACRRRQECRALFHQVNRGRGRTVTDGMLVAGGRVVGYIDIDLEVSPVYIPEMVDLILSRKADVVIGRRIYRTSPSSLAREILSVGYRLLVDQLLGTGGLDTETGYKFFNRQKIRSVLAKTQHPGWFWDTELMVWARRAGLKVVEVPVLFLRRANKKSSVRIWRDTLDYLLSLWRFRKSLRKRR